MFWKRLSAIIRPAAIRALRTFFQTFAGFLTVEGAMFQEVRWLEALSASGLAAIYSIVMSIATGLPEVDIDTRQ